LTAIGGTASAVPPFFVSFPSARLWVNFAEINIIQMRPLLTLPTSPTKTITRGDTWYGLGLKFWADKANNIFIDLTGATVKITLRHPVHTWTLETGDGITHTAPTQGEAAIDKITPLEVPAVTYLGDVQVTFPNGDIITYFDIKLTVSDDITK
jgi:hypothetical protein